MNMRSAPTICFWIASTGITSIAVTSIAVAAENPQTIALWPPAVLAAKGYTGEETNIPSTNKVDGRPFNQLGNVINPRMTIYRPPEGKANGAAVLVFPGGSYRI